jgi:hypothetical protein
MEMPAKSEDEDKDALKSNGHTDENKSKVRGKKIYEVLK